MTNTYRKLVLATRNAKKGAELQDLVTRCAPGVQVHTAADFDLPEVAETEVSFTGNALLKAHAAAQQTGLLAVADDSGLCVDVLGGAPGIFSARWSGQHGNDDANLELLLAQLADVAPAHRQAAFQCAAVAVTPEGDEFISHGTMTGTLLTERRGEAGFGYDPIFVPTGYQRSCAELSLAEKQAISHRGQALQSLVASLMAAGVFGSM